MKFQVRPHSVRLGVEVVEVFNDQGDFIATITAGGNDREIRIISKFMERVHMESDLPFQSVFPVPVARIWLAADGEDDNG